MWDTIHVIVDALLPLLPSMFQFLANYIAQCVCKLLQLCARDKFPVPQLFFSMGCRKRGNALENIADNRAVALPIGGRLATVENVT